MTRVLVVDDEPNLLRALSLTLTGRGYTVSTAASGGSALDLAALEHPDVIVLDLGLPDVDGFQVIRRLRERGDDTPIVVLSARAATQEKVTAFDLGANDYVTKPFDMNELVARLRAAARRLNLIETESVIVLGPITVDLGARLVRREDRLADGMTDDSSLAELPETIHLTPTEWRMLDALLRRPGMLISPTELLMAMRGDPEHTESSYLRIYMQQLRRKLEVDPTRPRYLLTEPGLGYRYQP
jgi:two-component system KDP operon response regulator KdpE